MSRIFVIDERGSSEFSSSDPEYKKYVEDVAAKSGSPIEPEFKKRTTPHDIMDHLFGHNTGIGYYIEYAVVFMVYGFIAAAIALVVYEGVWDLFGSTAAFAAAGFVCGVYIMLIGFVVHPWMRKHLPEKD